MHAGRLAVTLHACKLGASRAACLAICRNDIGDLLNLVRQVLLLLRRGLHRGKLRSAA
jgi:hypothetical protein